MSSPTRQAFTQRDQRHRLAVRSADPIVQVYHDQWLTRPFSPRHRALDKWVAESDGAFYAQEHTYLESLVRVTTLWLRRTCPRSPEQVVNVARAHGRKVQDVKRDLDQLLIERQRAALIHRSQRDARRTVEVERATARAYNQAAPLADEDWDDE